MLQNKCLLVLLCTFLSVCALASDNQHKNVNSEYVFKPSESPTQDVEAALIAAKQSNKPLLLVLGAQWCHDSRGLAEQFSTPQMSPILESSFETVFVDVGYLEDRRTLTQKFNYPTYFATPTVMVLNPHNEQHINTDSMDMWAHAASIELEEYVTYFTNYSKHKLSDKVKSEQNSVLTAFANQQAQRLQNAYAVLGPMLKQSRTGEDPEGFGDMWKAVRSFRIQAMADLTALDKKVKSGETIKSSELPTYESLSWEN